MSAAADRLLAWGPVGTPMDSYRGRFPATKHFLMVHLRDRDWNLEVMWEPDWTPRVRFAYPPWLVERAWRAVDEVRALIADRAEPFDGALYEWRPAG